MIAFSAHLRSRLDAIRDAGLLRAPVTSTSAPGPYIQIEGRKVLCLCSNNYLGLANDPGLRTALAEGAAQFGAGSGASRLISGTNLIHRAAEAVLAEWVGMESSLSFSTGYAANVGAVQALVGKGDLIVSDALNHASLIDGCRLSGATVLVVPHTDVDALRRCLQDQRSRFRAALVITESVFSMDGDCADLRALRTICDEFGAGLYVDDAHAIGVMGPAGAGACAAFHVKPDVLVGTLGKALGLSGAFVAGSKEVRALLENQARSYVFSTAPPAMLSHAAIRAVALAKEADLQRATLKRHSLRLRAALRAQGFAIPSGETSIIPLVLGTPERALVASAALLEAGVFVQAIRPPTVPEGTSRLRIVPIATHSVADMDLAVESFRTLRA
ncbi:MAG: 8-amino-7-oxononanoate synthase [Sandaracinaceae bacterium]|nr:8-amino-7-oxononanoate synthase [Sandaracinaceae bacterium]